VSARCPRKTFSANRGGEKVKGRQDTAVPHLPHEDVQHSIQRRNKKKKKKKKKKKGQKRGKSTALGPKKRGRVTNAENSRRRDEKEKQSREETSKTKSEKSSPGDA